MQFLVLMKAKYTILLIAFGFCLGFTGEQMRLMHWQGWNTVSLMATILKVIGVLWFAFKVLSYEGFRRFMER
jgi:hypothetical protein